MADNVSGVVSTVRDCHLSFAGCDHDCAFTRAMATNLKTERASEFVACGIPCAFPVFLVRDAT